MTKPVWPHDCYQWDRDGKTVFVTDLTREELLDALCSTIDLIEEIEHTATKNPVTEMIEQWRKIG